YNWSKAGSGSDALELILAPKDANGERKPYPHEPGKGQQDDAVISDSYRTITNIRSNLSYTLFSGHRVSLNHKFENSGRDDKNLLIPERSKWITRNDVMTNIWAVNYEFEALNRRLRTNLFGKYAAVKTKQRIPTGEVDGVMV